MDASTSLTACSLICRPWRGRTLLRVIPEWSRRRTCCSWQAMTGLNRLQLECTPPGDPPGIYILGSLQIGVARGALRSRHKRQWSMGSRDHVKRPSSDSSDQQGAFAYHSDPFHATGRCADAMACAPTSPSLTICRDIRAVTTDSLAFEPLLPNATLLEAWGSGTRWSAMIPPSWRKRPDAGSSLDLDGPTSG